jgi:hypothetical protein
MKPLFTAQMKAWNRGQKKSHAKTQRRGLNGIKKLLLAI